jgi:hypothetical protein
VRRGVRKGAALIITIAGLAFSGPLWAQTVHIETRTIGRGTQFKRSDFSVEAERLFTQTMSVWGWNVLPPVPGDVDVHIGLRYLNDFGIQAEDRDDPFVQTQRSRFVLDVGELRYSPFESLSLMGGRQWVPSALGMRDIDGGRLRWTPDLGDGVGANIDLHAGREVASSWATIDPDAWDVQGLPLDVDGRGAGGLRWGGSAGIGFDRASLDVAYQRRDFTEEDGERRVGDERVGAGLHGNPFRTLAVSSSASYHLLLEDVDRAELDLAWRAPWADAVLSGGIEHRRPWFDSSSIFNVFGARPWDGAHLTYQHPLPEIRTSIEARSWARAYDADFDLGNLGAGPEDARAVGAGVGHQTKFRAFGRSFQWRTFGSVQTSEDLKQGGQQWLGDVRFRFAPIRRKLFLTGRFLGLRAVPGATSPWDEGGAFTAVIAADVPVSFGEFNLTIEGTSSTFYGPNTNAYASFVSDLWL